MRTCRAVARGFTVAVAVSNRDGIATPNADTYHRAYDYAYERAYHRANRDADDRATADRDTVCYVVPDPERARSDGHQRLRNSGSECAACRDDARTALHFR